MQKHVHSIAHCGFCQVDIQWCSQHPESTFIILWALLPVLDSFTLLCKCKSLVLRAVRTLFHCVMQSKLRTTAFQNEVKRAVPAWMCHHSAVAEGTLLPFGHKVKLRQELWNWHCDWSQMGRGSSCFPTSHRLLPCGLITLEAVHIALPDTGFSAFSGGLIRVEFCSAHCICQTSPFRGINKVVMLSGSQTI